MSLEAGSTEAAKFSERLTAQIDRENETIRETDFAIAGDFKRVWFQWSDASFSSKPSDVFVDKMNRVYVPLAVLANGRHRTVKGVSFSNDPNKVIPVERTEPRYEGANQTSLVCYLEAT